MSGQFSQETQKERDELESLKKDRNLKLTLKKQEGLDLSGSELTPLANYCKHKDEPSCSMKWWECFD